MNRRTSIAALGAVALLASGVLPTWAGAVPEAPACDLAPPGSYWSSRADDLPLHPSSDTYVASIGLDANVHPDFGAGLWDGGPIGIPYTTVPGDQQRVSVTFDYADESDPSPYPIPADAPIEGGPGADGDRHVLIVDRDACDLWELFDAHPQGDGSWHAGSGARFDLETQALRPDTWTSADAAGLPILPGLVRYDEVAAGAVDHVIRMTVPRSQNTYLWPARHQAGQADSSLPPMGLRLRLKAGTDLSGLGPQATVIAQAMQRHGMIVADNGSAWFLSGVPDDRWDNDDLRGLRDFTGADFEAVDASGLMRDPDSAWTVDDDVAAARVWGGSGTGRVETAVALSADAFPAGATAAVLTRADAFADALAAGPLAVAVDGPVLLTGTNELHAATAAELERLGVDTVHLAGGPGAVSKGVRVDLENRGYEVVRHAGTERFATAAALADAASDAWRPASGGASRVLLALGEHADPNRAWPDGLASTPLAAVLQAPLLLTRGDALPGSTEAALADLGVERVTIIGGSGAISQAVSDDLTAAGYEVDRLGGTSRYGTAVLVAGAAAAAGADAGTVLVATGQAFPDALAAGPAVAARGGVLLLTARDSAPADTSAHLRDNAITWLRVAGGPGAVTDPTVRALLDAAS